MISPGEAEIFLRSVRGAIADKLRPNVTTSAARADADAAIAVLDRLISDLGEGDHVARSQAAVWDSLAARLSALGLESREGEIRPDGFLGGRIRLEAEIAAIQARLDEPRGFSTLTERLASGDALALDWLSCATDAIGLLTRARAQDAVAQESDGPAGAPVDEIGPLKAGLGRYLSARYPYLPEDAIIAFRLSPGGYAKKTALFTLKPNSDLPERLVLRLDMAGGLTGTSVREEYPIIDRVFRLGLPVPRPVLLETDPSVLGGCFMLMTEIPESIPSGPYFPDERVAGEAATGPDFGRQVARVLARLHSGTRAARSTELPNYRKMVTEARDSWAPLAKGPYSIAVELGYAWLVSHPPEADRPWCLVHGDFGAHNILTRGGEFAGLIDWELAHLGDPAEDLAQCRMLILPGIMDWDEFVAEYISAGGDPRACNARAVSYFCVWLYLYHMTNNAILRGRFLSGERRDILSAKVVSHYQALLVDYLARALRLAIDAAGHDDLT